MNNCKNGFFQVKKLGQSTDYFSMKQRLLTLALSRSQVTHIELHHILISLKNIWGSDAQLTKNCQFWSIFENANFGIFQSLHLMTFDLDTFLLVKWVMYLGIIFFAWVKIIHLKHIL